MPTGLAFNFVTETQLRVNSHPLSCGPTQFSVHQHNFWAKWIAEKNCLSIKLIEAPGKKCIWQSLYTYPWIQFQKYQYTIAIIYIYIVHWGTLPRGQNSGILPKEAWRLPRTPWSKLIFFSLFSCLVWQWPGVQLPVFRGPTLQKRLDKKHLEAFKGEPSETETPAATTYSMILIGNHMYEWGTYSFNHMYDIQLPCSTVAVKNCGLVKNSIVVIPLLLKRRWKPEKATIVPPNAMTKISVQTSHSLVQKVISVWKACAIADTSQHLQRS